MRLDPDLIRAILLAVEDYPDAYATGSALAPAVVAEHFRLAAEAGFIEARVTAGKEEDPASWTRIRLTWSGHEFLAQVRDAARWEAAKVRVRERLGDGANLTAIMMVLEAMAEEERTAAEVRR
jgi:Hypothetical protein (DUF2513)